METKQLQRGTLFANGDFIKFYDRYDDRKMTRAIVLKKRKEWLVYIRKHYMKLDVRILKILSNKNCRIIKNIDNTSLYKQIKNKAKKAIIIK